MKNKYLLVIFCLSIINHIHGQIQGPITNVTMKISEEQDKVTIYYDLARNSKVPFYSIKTNILLDGEKVEARGLSGHIGSQVTAGLGKKIVWDVHQDLTELSGKLEIEVLTDTKTTATGPCQPIKTFSAYAGIGGVVLSGLSLILLGLSKEKDSNDLYDVYKNNLDPNSQVYIDTNLSREDHYLEANNKHKEGTWITAGGAAIIVIGGYIFISRLIKIKKYNKDCAGKTTYLPNWNVQPNIVLGSANNQLGLTINYKF